MTLEPKDDLDRTIDEALASIVSGEPRRVNAASVRDALTGRRSPSIPVWFAIAAVLVVGLAVSLRERRFPGTSPKGVATSAVAGAPTVPQSPPSPESTPVSVSGFRKAANHFAVDASIDRVYEGLPRLTIAAIDLPEPLSTGDLGADAIQTPRIEIAPLSLFGLSFEQEQRKNPLP